MFQDTSTILVHQEYDTKDLPGEGQATALHWRRPCRPSAPHGAVCSSCCPACGVDKAAIDKLLSLCTGWICLRFFLGILWIPKFPIYTWGQPAFWSWLSYWQLLLLKANPRGGNPRSWWWLRSSVQSGCWKLKLTPFCLTASWNTGTQHDANITFAGCSQFQSRKLSTPKNLITGLSSPASAFLQRSWRALCLSCQGSFGANHDNPRGV